MTTWFIGISIGSTTTIWQPSPSVKKGMRAFEGPAATVESVSEEISELKHLVEGLVKSREETTAELKWIELCSSTDASAPSGASSC